MADDTRRQSTSAHDVILCGYDAPATETRVVHVVNETPTATANGVVVRVAGSVVSPAPSSTATLSNVADNAASVTLLAANTNRRGATITNDSSARLYIKLGATASTTSYTVSLSQHGYYEVPFGYTGVIDGIWASDPNDGAARVTEYTA